MSDAIRGLEPALLWKYFAEISRIPRGSKNETAVARYVVEAARKLGLEVRQDKVGNVVVRKPASRGREGRKSVCLQGHLDMVCEKNADKQHDFQKDPITIVRKDNVLMADGTTLGADNGIAVATNLALMEASDIEHGPLEFLFTIDEETGLTGANNLQSDFVRSRTLINLDSEEEGALYVGCAGGKDSVGAWKIEREPALGGCIGLKIMVKGLKGGHSGLEIDKGRANALKLLARTLLPLEEMGLRIVELSGGSKRNAIPREAHALCCLPAGKLDELRRSVAATESTLKDAFATTDPDLAITVEKVDPAPAQVLKAKKASAILKTIRALPHGVIRMSADIPGLVETSTNVAVITTEEKKVELATSQRSSVPSEILEIAAGVKTVFELGGAKVVQSAGYPSWKPNLRSEILAVAKRSYSELFGQAPHVKAIHAGLECGIIGEKYPGMDMVSCGPTLEGVHSPDEKIHIDTVGRYLQLVLRTLKNVI